MPDITVPQAPQSHWFRNLMIIIIIALLIWQFILPVFITVKTPSEYVEDFLSTPSTEAVYFNAFIIDHYTGKKTIFPIFQPLPAYEKWDYQLTAFHIYSIGMDSNLPGSPFASYHWNTEITIYNETTHLWDTYPMPAIIKGYTCYYDHSWSIPGYIDYQKDYSIRMVLYDDNGDPIKARELVPGITNFYQTISLLKAP